MIDISYSLIRLKYSLVDEHTNSFDFILSFLIYSTDERLLPKLVIKADLIYPICTIMPTEAKGTYLNNQ